MTEETLKNLGPIIGAGITALIALIVVGVNQYMEHLRWKENLNRKGENKYIEKKLNSLHDSTSTLESIKFRLDNTLGKWSEVSFYRRGDLLTDTEKEHTFYTECIGQVVPYIKEEVKNELKKCNHLFYAIKYDSEEGDVDIISDNIRDLILNIGKVQSMLTSELSSFQKDVEEKEETTSKNFNILKLVVILLFAQGVLTIIDFIKNL